MENKIERFLPIGSVVRIKDTNKRVMITGYLVSTAAAEQKIFDYIACLYPEGVISSNANIVFNHSDIYQVYAIGYSDEAQKEFSQRIKEIDSNIRINNMDDVKDIFDRNNLSGEFFDIATNNNSNASGVNNNN